MQKKFIELNSVTMRNCCFFQGSIEKEQAGHVEFKEAKDKLKKKTSFHFRSERKGKNCTWSLPKRGEVTLYTRQLLKKSTFRMLIHTPNELWPVSLLLILKFIHQQPLNKHYVTDATFLEKRHLAQNFG